MAWPYPYSCFGPQELFKPSSPGQDLESTRAQAEEVPRMWGRGKIAGPVPGPGM